jgi:hypothetical protein
MKKKVEPGDFVKVLENGIQSIIHWMRNAQSKVSKTDLLWLLRLKNIW